MKNVFFILLLVIATLQCAADNRLLVVAHRGGAGSEPENTLSRIERSIASGVEAVEVDVRQTKDGHIVVFHDATVDAKTNGSGKISEMMLDEVRLLCITDEEGRATSERIPTLDELLALVGGRCKLLIEVKGRGNATTGIEERLIDVIEKHDASSLIAVQSFDIRVLKRLHAKGAAFPLEKLAVFKVPLLPLLFDGSLSRFSPKKQDYISSYNFHKKCLSRSLAKKIRKAGKEVKIWTLYTPDEMPHEIVNGVITDHPELWQ